MSNAKGMAALDAQIERIHELADLGKRSAPAAARAVEVAFHKQIAAGKDAEGKAWPKTQDGEPALQGAGKNLVVVAVGASVFARLTAWHARHNNGTAKGGVQRAIFPRQGLPRTFADAVRAEVTKEFREIMS